MSGRKKVPFPYTDIASPVLSAIYESLSKICHCYFEGRTGSHLQKDLRAIAQRARPRGWHKDKLNPHIWEGLGLRRIDSSFSDPLPRLSRICLEAFRHAQERFGVDARRSTKSDVYFLPSPLGILRDVLTVPSKPESAAYALTLARAHLFRRFMIHPPDKRFSKAWRALSVSQIQEIVESFRVYVLHRDNIHLSINKPERMLVAHFLALQGILSLRMGTVGKRRMRTTKDAQQACLEFLRAKEFLNVSAPLFEDYEFRLASGYSDLPDSQEIINGLMGIPIPLRGASTVFFEGLMRSHTNSLVISVSGAPGTGKTSFALALATTFAPYGTECVYFTFEEDAETLRRRVTSLTPDYFRRSTLPNVMNNLKWFAPFELDAPQTGSLSQFAHRYLSIFEHGLRARSKPPHISDGELPAVAPLLVVIDSITVLSVGEDIVEELCRLVKRLRYLGCIVIILSPDEVPRGSRLDYLVDTVVCLRHEGTESADTKPFRLFQLVKTRLQLSRPGAHILHLSGEEGVRISPQLPSQIDARKIHKLPLPDTRRVINSFYVEHAKTKADSDSHRLIDIYKGSRVLVHGHGSAGKASLGLKILMAPIISKQGATPSLFPEVSPGSRILVTSFLYPELYYLEHHLMLAQGFRRRFKGYKTPELKGLVLPPGFLRGEDLVARLLKELDKGVLEGRPYTGVLLDGLHNVFLQFPLLQRSDMSWPALYNLLARFELTVVTTFTTFNIDPLQRPDLQDADIVLTGQRPLLHALVQGADFYIRVEPRVLNLYERRFRVIVRSAIYQRIPNRSIVWNAEKLIFDGIENLSDQELRSFHGKVS